MRALRRTKPAAPPAGPALPRGPRDTRSWYREADAMEQVDLSLVAFVAEHGGRRLLDLGCGLGGYSKVLADRGFDVVAYDVLPEYVERARALGVDADAFDGVRLPLGDGAVDTVFLLEVLEHLEDPAALLREARRVARRNVLVTTPNCDPVLRPRAGRVQPHARRRPPAVLHGDVDAARCWTRSSAAAWSSRSPRSTGSSPGSSCRGRCGRSTAGSTTTGTSSRGTSSGCAAGRPPAERAAPRAGAS